MKSLKRHDARIHRAWNAAAFTHATAPRAALEDGVALKDRSGKDIEPLLADLQKRRGIADRQVRRAELALRIMHEMFLPHYTPVKHTTLALSGKHSAQEANNQDGLTGLPEHPSLPSVDGGTLSQTDKLVKMFELFLHIIPLKS